MLMAGASENDSRPVTVHGITPTHLSYGAWTTIEAPTGLAAPYYRWRAYPC